MEGEKTVVIIAVKIQIAVNPTIAYNTIFAAIGISNRLSLTALRIQASYCGWLQKREQTPDDPRVPVPTSTRYNIRLHPVLCRTKALMEGNHAN